MLCTTEIMPNFCLLFLDKSAIKSFYKAVLYGVHFPQYGELIMQWDRLYPCFQLRIAIIFVGICCFFSSMPYVYAENWISLHIKCYQIQNFTLKVVSHEAWSKDKYSIYFSGLQQSRVFHELLRIINEASPVISDNCDTVPFQFFFSKSSTANLVTWQIVWISQPFSDQLCSYRVLDFQSSLIYRLESPSSAAFSLAA